jgi:predicted nucleic acid-binding protein
VILVDSCGWLELFASSPLGEAYRPALASADQLLVPTVCLLEVGRRLLAWSGEAAAAAGAAVMSQATVVPLDAAVALEAARLGPAWALPCADSVIYATALRHDAEVWTHDAHFRELPGVRFIAARPPAPV